MRKAMILAVLLAAACGDAEQQAQEGPPPDTSGGRPDLTHPDVGAKVMVTIADSAITLSQDSVPAVGTGQITLAIQNKGTVTQDLEINGGSKGTWKSGPIPPEQTILMSMLMERGSYDLRAMPNDSANDGARGTLRIF